MALSKPIIKSLSFYLNQQYEHPLRTAALTCATVAISGNVAYQKLAGIRPIDLRSILSFGAFGLCFSSICHTTFFNFLEWAAPEEASFSICRRLILERLIYFPLYKAWALYMVARFEGKSSEVALDEVKALLPTLLISSLKYLTITQLLNLLLVPSVFRIFGHYLTAFVWTIYFAHVRRQYEQKKKNK
ncbi:uncharacterized protein LOC143190908 [Rhynchophorus ferrugineus]|uniref:Peroxisomal membrane protein 2 n=1 Tax=Rhynchophorus ferrugineus TaxID=354439 RepID=A0A834MD94_RHYFE|nr:hypothetical protein GWI33_013416 [Rhynchophorus ferrugineus]